MKKEQIVKLICKYEPKFNFLNIDKRFKKYTKRMLLDFLYVFSNGDYTINGMEL